jgi:hypothetical protein
MEKNKKSVLLLIMMTLPLIFNGQAKDEEALNYNWFDSIIGLENSELHNGLIYFEKYKVKNKKSQFFYSPDYLLGSVVFNDQTYFGLDLKYNVYDDEVLMRVENRFGGKTLQLYKNKISGFTIKERRFIKIDFSSTNKAFASGFYEVSKENPFFILFIKHRKKMNEHVGEKSVYHEFEDQKKTYMFWYQDKYHLIKKVTDLTNLFPQHKEKLDSFYNNQEQKSNIRFAAKLNSLLIYLGTLLPEKNEKIIEN